MMSKLKSNEQSTWPLLKGHLRLLMILNVYRFNKKKVL